MADVTMDADVPPFVRAKLEVIAGGLEEMFNGNGYLVMVFPPNEFFKCAYVSNMARKGLIDRLKLQIAMLEGKAIPGVEGTA